MLTNDETVRFLSVDGAYEPSDAAQPFASYLDDLTTDDLVGFYREMVVVRRMDQEGHNLQRQGQLGLWVPSQGQEAAQIGSAHAARRQDHLFPSYREHAVAYARGVDLIGVVALLRGLTHGGWDATDPANGNVHNYTLVIGSHALHATGYAMGVALDGMVGTGTDDDTAVLCYFGDGATSQGDVSEAFVFSASSQAPVVFFVQNNQWAISVPVTTQSRVPLVERPRGFGIPSTQIDGNDVLASYAVTRMHLDAARAGEGPRMIEALTYRLGAHTSSDDPTKYQAPELLAEWQAKDPVPRLRRYLESLEVERTVFESIDIEAEDHAADIRRRTHELPVPDASALFDHVYSEPHPVMAEQKDWLARYESSYGAA